jgi:Xaa-Pro aminopeptidase
MPEIRYLTEFRAHDTAAVLTHAGETVLLVSSLEKGRACEESKACRCTVKTPEEIPGYEKGGLDEALVLWLKSKRLKSVRLMPRTPFSLIEKLRHREIKPVLLKSEQLPDRSVKKEGEVEKMAEVQRAACQAMRVAVDCIRDATVDAKGFLRSGRKKVDCERVRTLIGKALLERHCFAETIIAAGGVQSANPHAVGEGPLRAGEPLVIDIFPRHLESGYWGDLTRTVCKGAAPERLKKMHRAVGAAQTEALRLLKHGMHADAVHKKVQQILDRHGFKTKLKCEQPYGFIHGTGHGVGLEIHEAPRIARSGEKLRTGQVVTVEPGLYYPEIGGVRIEDTVVITPSGYKKLAFCPAFFEIE